MKRILLLFFCILFFPLTLNAECSNEEINELNGFSLHVTSSYEFNKDTFSFDLSIYNLNDNVYVEYLGNRYYSYDGVVSINNLFVGSNITYNIVASDRTGCSGKVLNTYTVVLPYYNSFYNSVECFGHEKLKVCNSEFLSYQLTDELFQKYIKNDSKYSSDSNIIDNNQADDNKIKYDFEIFIKIGLVLLGILIPTIYCAIRVNKIKSKF